VTLDELDTKKRGIPLLVFAPELSGLVPPLELHRAILILRRVDSDVLGIVNIGEVEVALRDWMALSGIWVVVCAVATVARRRGMRLDGSWKNMILDVFLLSLVGR
jgi:hypothetical protein